MGHKVQQVHWKYLRLNPVQTGPAALLGLECEDVFAKGRRNMSITASLFVFLVMYCKG